MIQRFRARVVPAVIVLSVGALFMYIAAALIINVWRGQHVYEGHSHAAWMSYAIRKAVPLGFAGLLCFMASWCLMVKKWEIGLALASIAMVLAYCSF